MKPDKSCPIFSNNYGLQCMLIVLLLLGRFLCDGAETEKIENMDPFQLVVSQTQDEFGFLSFPRQLYSSLNTRMGSNPLLISPTTSLEAFLPSEMPLLSRSGVMSMTATGTTAATITAIDNDNNNNGNSS